DDGEHLVLVYELLDRGDAPLGLAKVVLADQHQLASVDAALLVELVEVDLHAVHGELAVDVDWAGERPERAHLDLGIGDSRNIGALRTERSDEGDGKGHADCGCKLLHLEPPGVRIADGIITSRMALERELPRSRLCRR